MSSIINQDAILSGKVSTQDVLLSGKVATLETLIGPPGPQGPKGDPGDSYTVKGLYATLSALQAAHPTGSVGDAWFVGTADSNVVYQWDVDQAAWVNVGELKGPKGDTGANGKSAYASAQDGGYTGTEAEFATKLAQEQLTGTTDELTPTQVYEAVSAGIPVKVQYTDSTYGLIYFTAFAVAESLNVIASNIIVYYNGGYILAELWGYKFNNEWGFNATTLAQKTDIPTALPNPNALTFTGAVTVTYNGTNPVSIEIPSAVTDEHINSLIDTKLGVIENGAY